MKIAITGKGGVGKTTLTVLLAGLLAEGKKVTVVDADPSMNLALALGVPAEIRDKIVPLADMKELIQERSGSSGGFFKLNPKVDDLAAKLEISYQGLRLIVMGTIPEGGSGCACAENVVLRAFLSHLLLDPEEVVIVDMVAGLEHLGRRTVQSVDALLVVVEPGRRSIDVGLRIKKLAADIGLTQVFFVANKVCELNESRFISDNLADEKLLAVMPASQSISKADREGLSPYTDLDEQTRQALRKLKESLEQGLSEQ